jgi:hypothetical protein
MAAVLVALIATQLATPPLHDGVEYVDRLSAN